MPSNKKLPNNVWQFSAESFFLLLAGGVLYYALEVLWRGHSHISMAICGAVCLFAIYHMNAALTQASFLLRAFLGALIITAAEFLTGYLVNIGMGLSVWDYSEQPYNLFGQICLLYSLLWFLLCIPVGFFCRLIRRFVFCHDA